MKSTISILGALALCLSLTADAQPNSLGGLAFEGSGSQSHGGAFTNAQNLGPEDPSKLITVTVWLKQHNKAVLDELVRQMYQPGSPNYHRWLTREQYRSRFAPTAAEVAQMRDYLTSHNFNVTSVDKFSHYLVAQGRVSDAQDAFNVQLSRVNLKGHIHRVSNASATIPGPLGELVMAVQGLDDFAARPTLVPQLDLATGKPVAPRPFSFADAAANAVSPNQCMTGTQHVTFTSPHHGPTATYSGNRYAGDVPGNCPGYTPSQIQTAYGLNALYNKGWDGTGQTIVIVDAYGSKTIEQDANTFSAAYGLPPLTSSNFQIYYPGGKTTCGKGCNVVNGWNYETTLDVEWAHAVAPGASIALVLAPDQSSLDIAELWAIENPEINTSYANSDLGYVISNSWAYPENGDYDAGLQTQLAMTELAAALGISANFASGDWGDNAAYLSGPPSVCMPASSPYATGVGGTSMFLKNDGQIQFQTGWGLNVTKLTNAGPNHPYDPPLEFGNIGGSGGGSSSLWPAPPFQSSLGNAYRQVPDISWLADAFTGVNIIVTFDGSTVNFTEGGTSVATPMFSGLWAIANQAAGAKAPLGQAAPMLYTLPADAITDILPFTNGANVRGKITDPPQPVLIETAADLAQPLENTTTFLSALGHGTLNGRSYPWYVLTFGTDTSLVTAPGWDNVTGLGTPNGLHFVDAVVAAANNESGLINKRAAYQQAPGFTLSASPNAVTIGQGASGTSTITITPLNGFSGNVKLAASRLPNGVSASFSPNPATSTSTLTLTASETALTGTVTVTITGRSGSLSATTTITLTVDVVPNFTLTAHPNVLTVQIDGSSGTSLITVVPTGGFDQAVTLSLSGVPHGTSWSFSPNPTTSTSTLTLWATRKENPEPGTYKLTVTGTYGSLSHSTEILLMIQQY